MLATPRHLHHQNPTQGQRAYCLRVLVLAVCQHSRAVRVFGLVTLTRVSCAHCVVSLPPLFARTVPAGLTF